MISLGLRSFSLIGMILSLRSDDPSPSLNLIDSPELATGLQDFDDLGLDTLRSCQAPDSGRAGEIEW